ncbi:MAG: hypothetical protein NXH75_07150 [Halobacteriovoraceae bacterium]|nr:hypothetical protein [Halobacteriovoraceae bacterium]
MNKKLLITFLFSLSSSLYAQNMVFCWIFEMQGCPGVEDKQGASVNRGGGTAFASGGAKRDRVYNRRMIELPSWGIWLCG